MNKIREQFGPKHWDRVARFYNLFRFNPISYALLHKEQNSIRDLLDSRERSSDPGRALDLGMGNGLSLDLMPSDISHIYALDQSPEMVARTRIKYSHVETIVGNALNTPYDCQGAVKVHH